MGEVLGIVASGIAIAQLAQATGSAVLKLKQLWNEVEDTGDTIQDLMDQIDCLDPALWEAEQIFNQNILPSHVWDGTAAKNSARYCRIALQKLTDIVTDLSAQIDSAKRRQKKIGIVKVVLKRKELGGAIENRLANAVRILHVAQNGYLIAQNRVQPDLIAAKVVSLLNAGSSHQELALIDQDRNTDCGHNEDGDPTGNPLRRRAKISQAWINATRPWKKTSTTERPALERACNGYVMKFHPPLWLAGWMYSWDLNVRRSYAGWDANLRVYSIRPCDSECFHAAQRGDIHQLKKLMMTREAMPHDRDNIGWTLLHYAAHSMNGEMVKFLLGLDVDPNETNNSGRTPVDFIFQWAKFYTVPSTSKLLKFINDITDTAFIPEVRLDAEIEQQTCNCPITPIWEQFQAMQPLACPGHIQTSLSSRLAKARELASCPSTIEYMMILLGPEWCEHPQVVCNMVDAEASLIHTASDIIYRLEENMVCRQLSKEEFPR